MTSKLKCPFRQGYEKPLHYPCTIMVKAKAGKSIDKRLYCDIFSTYFKREKEWDGSVLKDNIEWWCYATDLERYIKQLQKDLEIARKALKDIASGQIIEHSVFGHECDNKIAIARNALEQIDQKDAE